MSDLTGQIVEVIGKHRLMTTSWGQTHCKCQESRVVHGEGMSYALHENHVASEVVAALGLKQEEQSYYDHAEPFSTGYESRWVSEWRKAE